MAERRNRIKTPVASRPAVVASRNYSPSQARRQGSSARFARTRSELEPFARGKHLVTLPDYSSQPTRPRTYY